jgi:hypothetical protein
VNTRYVDMVQTIPKGALFPMCGMNLGFNKELIGPAMYFGLMGDGQPIGRYDDMWAGWCCKVNHQSIDIVAVHSAQKAIALDVCRVHLYFLIFFLES